MTDPTREEDSMSTDPIVQAVAFALANPSVGKPEWFTRAALGRDMTPLAEAAVAAARPLIESERIHRAQRDHDRIYDECQALRSTPWKGLKIESLADVVEVLTKVEKHLEQPGLFSMSNRAGMLKSEVQDEIEARGPMRGPGCNCPFGNEVASPGMWRHIDSEMGRIMRAGCPVHDRVTPFYPPGLCDGCKVREPFEHRCHGGHCTCGCKDCICAMTEASQRACPVHGEKAGEKWLN